MSTTTRVEWWMERMEHAIQSARTDFKLGVVPVALAHLAEAVEALADVAGELELKSIESEALSLRNDLFDAGDKWDDERSAATNPNNTTTKESN